MSQQCAIVVGAGVAGMMASIRLAEQGVSVDLITDGTLGLSDAVMATEGLAAACDVKGEGDSFERHFEDTVKGGDYLANQELPRQMCLFAPELAGLLDRMGVLFARSETFSLDGRRLSGHRYRRLLFAEKGIGGQIVSALVRQIFRFEVEGKVTLHEGMEFLSAVRKENGRCCGVIAMNQTTMELVSFTGGAVIMATGGFGRLFKNSTQSLGSTGAPLSILYQQGVALANMEFVQSHPTTSAGVDKNRLVSKSASPPTEYVPAIHATLGGLWTDEDHMTNIPGLLAVGDATFQYHGARRLPGNGLLASLYGGLKGARTAFHYLSNLGASLAKGENTSLFQGEIKKQHAFNQELLDLSGSENTHQLYEELIVDMAENFLGPRINKNLSRLGQKIEELETRFRKITLFDRGLYANRELIFARRVRNMFDLAQVVARGAFLRNETRGVHVKPEFPHRNDAQFLKTTKTWWTPEGPRIEYEDVNVKYLRPTYGISHYQNQAPEASQ